MGCSLALQHHNNEPKKTQHNDNMVAEQVLCDLSVRRASVMRYLGAQSKCYAISRCAEQVLCDLSVRRASVIRSLVAQSKCYAISRCAEQVLCDLSVRRASVVRSLGAQSKCYAISRCAEQCVPMECAEIRDVCNTVRSDDLSNVVSRAEALWQCKLGFSTDKMVGDNKVLTARCRWNGTASVPAECQNSVNCVGNRCGSHGVCVGDTNCRSFE